MMKQIHILWVDDEIELLKPHILFLHDRGYKVVTCHNGTDALRLIDEQDFDIILLDEHMPGLSGLDTLNRLKTITPSTPVVMITKSEEENLMEDAIGSKIADYLIKPVNPKQILLTIKKNTEQKKLVSEKTTTTYQSEFSNITNLIHDASSFQDWIELYKILIYWELELEKLNDPGMLSILQSQHADANQKFARYIRQTYLDWIGGSKDRPTMSQNLIRENVLPFLQAGKKVFLLVIDNLRYDQWKIMSHVLTEYYRIEQEELYCSILPTVTQYARNSIFAGLMPLAIRKIYPNLWNDNDEDEMNNQFEEDLLRIQLSRLGVNTRFAYEKISNLRAGNKVVENIKNYFNYDFSVMVFNFVDILSHARTSQETIRELSTDEAAYRTLTLSWFMHSYLFELLKVLANEDCKVIITTDHGSTKVSNPVKVIGDKATSVNLRYKQGKNLSFNPKEIFEIRNPEAAQLPRFNISTSFIFATGDDFMAYPNNYNHYASYYRNTFQHGGISLEEMLIPFVVLNPMK